MKIAKQGRRFIGMGLLADLAGAGFIVSGSTALGALLLVLGSLFSAFCVYFFRDPERAPAADPRKIYSPADGVVLSLAREGADDGATLRIFLSIFDVHVQRAPCSGRVEKVEHFPGSFRAAMKEEAKANERWASSLAASSAGRRPATRLRRESATASSISAPRPRCISPPRRAVSSSRETGSRRA